VRELWDDPLRYRADGIWATRARRACSPPGATTTFTIKRLHCHWAPLNSRVDGDFPRADLVFYHLRMLHAEGPRERARGATKPPTTERAFQSIGYDYLTKIEGLRLADVERDRAYAPLPGRALVAPAMPAF
jgi:hypothetical protein